MIARLDSHTGRDIPKQPARRRQARSSIFAIVILGALVISCLTWTRTGTFEVMDRVVPLIDGHNDFAIWLRVFHGNRINGLNSSSTIDGQVDLPRLIKGKVQAQFWSVYVECPKDSEHFSSSSYYVSVHDTLQQIDLVNRLVMAFPEHLQHAYTSGEIWSNLASRPDRVSSLMGVEGLHQIGNSVSILRIYHRLGVRYVTLTHDCNNIYADAALAPRKAHGGLSEAGRTLMREMNRMGMLIDLSHTSDDTMSDALDLSLAPVIFSHSSARALCDHPRNVPDSILSRLQRNGGVVMISFYPGYTNCKFPDRASLGDVADHILYVGNLIGFEHVGIGSDFDGMAKGPLGLEDVSKYPDLLAELARRGISRHDVRSVAGGNILRVLAEGERVAHEMGDMLPLEDFIE
ncbi:microsomal dipeptidase [Amylocarpus encephaloides]|uniref:Dipeptidase n=1 Tax=Amylocarpus encephaloides TaxID=45428 RepID=A0A9P7YD52_9HELO|nr:microsomal dipeptidase [Amylocarpus encephaloides]